MEVHQHSHHGKKKWTEYFWDFFMLFLAVTLGFFVENQREHYVEHQREKLYMRSMTEDLKKDTTMLSYIKRRSQSVLDHIDSALVIFQNETLNDKNISDLYRVNLSLLSNTAPTFTDRTTVQLKNAGAMRLIRHQTTVDGIVNYWSEAENIKAVSDLLEDYKIKARERSYSIFDQKYYNSLSTGPALMISDKLQLTEFANRLAHIKNLINNRYITAINSQSENAKKLIETINHNY
jgi:hypothetical protein